MSLTNEEELELELNVNDNLEDEEYFIAKAEKEVAEKFEENDTAVAREAALEDMLNDEDNGIEEKNRDFFFNSLDEMYEDVEPF